MKSEYVLPEHGLEAFNCPQCHVFASQYWYHMKASAQPEGHGRQYSNGHFMISNCAHCDFPTIWHDETMVYPLHADAEPPNPDLPENVRADYEEARLIAALSPRGAAALLRLAIQKLCAHLGQPGQNINDDIKALVAVGLPHKVQEALDSVRVIGNEAVHPGTLDLKDDHATATALFRLVNFIAQKMITEPREIDSIYGGLPQGKLEAIKKRDQNS